MVTHYFTFHFRLTRFRSRFKQSNSSWQTQLLEPETVTNRDKTLSPNDKASLPQTCPCLEVAASSLDVAKHCELIGIENFGICCIASTRLIAGYKKPKDDHLHFLLSATQTVASLSVSLTTNIQSTPLPPYIFPIFTSTLLQLSLQPHSSLFLSP